MLRKEEYFKAVRRGYTPLTASMILAGISNYDHYNGFLKERFAYRQMICSQFDWHYTWSETKLSASLTFKNWDSSKKLKEIEKICHKREIKLIESTKKSFHDFTKTFEEYMPLLVLVWVVENPVENKLRELFAKKLPQKELDEIMKYLGTPLENNFYKQEEYDLLMSKNIENHVKKYEWINSRYGEYNPYTVKDAQNRLKGMNKKNFLRKWHEEKQKITQTISKAKKILGKKNSYLVDFIQFIVWCRTQRTDIINKSIYLFIPKFKELAKEKEITYKELLYCSKEEVIGEIPSRDIIKQRMNQGFAVPMEDGRIRCVQGKEAEEIEKFFESDTESMKEFKGTIACEGIVKGKAKIILDRNDYNKIKKGNILVSSMTTPNMISIMKKSAAFITDEGGITCHAGILSREMKKPCIIATKIATEVLKDGDLVEVDADKGMVRVLKKN